MGQLFQQKYTDMAYAGKFDQKICRNTLTTASKLDAIYGGRTSDDFGASHYGIQMIKMGFNHF